jgi:glycerol-3-phosphate dehydrogenase
MVILFRGVLEQKQSIFDVKHASFLHLQGIINATGPFTDSIRQLDNPKIEKIVSPSSGVHIIFPGYYRYFF